MTVSVSLRDDVLEIIVDNPPVNALGHATRLGLREALERAAKVDDVKAVVIGCAGRTFFAGADISEFGKPAQSPTLPELCDFLEQFDKPVVAAIHGTALGGGLEVAMACHYRVALPSARLGTPEVKLGLLPGAGGTQRLPRLVGVDAALEMIVFGNPIAAAKGFELGLISAVATEGNLIANASAMVRAKADVRPLPRAADRTAAGDLVGIDQFETANMRKLRGQDAPRACIEAIRASVELPFADGLALERRLFQKLVTGAQSPALRHVFFAERKASRIDGLEAEPRPISSVGVIGAGTMGAGIAVAFLSAGLPVVLLDMSQDALERGLATVERTYDSSIAKGRMSGQAREACLALLSSTLHYADLGNCDLIIEAAFELMEVKHEVFARIDRVARPGAILATNTSYLDVDEIAQATSRPEQVVGLHFFSPANIMKLLEVVRGARTAPDVLATAMAVAKHIGKIAVVSGVCFGFIGNRMLAKRRSAAFDLLMEGATPQQIDEAHVDFGMPMGPFQMSDLAGVDVGWHRDVSRIDTVRDALCAAGRLGQKTLKGYYDYDERRKARPSAEAQAIIEEFARTAGRSRRAITSAEILERTLFAMVNEGVEILDEGIAQRASDIDVVWIHGYGWPAFTGGPMYWADQIGLPKIVERLTAYGMPVARLLAEKAASGSSLSDEK